MAVVSTLRRAAYRATRSLARRFTGKLRRHPSAAAERFTVRGLEVHCELKDAAKRARLVKRLGQVIDRVAEIDACRYRWLSAVDTIEIMSWAQPSYSVLSDTILVGPGWLEEQPVDVVAHVLVHEATHARLARSVRPRRSNIERVEHICWDNQLDFIRRLAARGTTLDLVEQLRWWRYARQNPLPTKEEKREWLTKLVEANELGWVGRLVVRFGGGWSRDEIAS